MKKYIVALDQGTTSSRCIIFDTNHQIVCQVQREFPQYYPQPGWVEQSPMELYSCQYGVLMEVLAQSSIPVEEIAGIGITNQRETTVVWDKETGQPVYNAVVWQCRRTAGLCDELNKDLEFSRLVKERTGLLIDAYFSAFWIMWKVPGKKPGMDACCSVRLIRGFCGNCPAAGFILQILPMPAGLCYST